MCSEALWYHLHQIQNNAWNYCPGDIDPHVAHLPMQMQGKSGISFTWSWKCARNCLNTQWLMLIPSLLMCLGVDLYTIQIAETDLFWCLFLLAAVKSYNSGFLDFGTRERVIWRPFWINAKQNCYFVYIYMGNELCLEIYGMAQILLVLPTQINYQLDYGQKTNADTHFASWCSMPFY